jgi:hypothetical protein
MDEARNVTATFSSDDVEHLIFLPMVINNDVNAPDWVVDE